MVTYISSAAFAATYILELFDVFLRVFYERIPRINRCIEFEIVISINLSSINMRDCDRSYRSIFITLLPVNLEK